MASRRKFIFSMAAVGSAIVPAVLAETEKPAIVMSDGERKWDGEYRGYKLRWTDWKTAYNQDVIVAQWLAYKNEYIETGKWEYPDKTTFLYASDPGGEGHYFPHGAFDIATRKDQLPVPTVGFSEKKKEQRKQVLLERMKRLIDKTVADMV